MEPGAEFSVPHDISTVMFAEEISAKNKQRNYWWIEDNWPRLKKALSNSRYPYLRGN